MAKVYDALKQVEAERSRQLRAASERSRVVSRPEPTFWRRFSGRFSAGNDAAPAGGAAIEIPPPPGPTSKERAVHERMETLVGRLDSFEHLAKNKIPELERNLLQVLEERIEGVEREVGGAVAALGGQLRREVEVLNRRLTMLMGAVVLLLVVVLVRG